jgi:hypothetical protein
MRKKVDSSSRNFAQARQHSGDFRMSRSGRDRDKPGIRRKSNSFLSHPKVGLQVLADNRIGPVLFPPA